MDTMHKYIFLSILLAATLLISGCDFFVDEETQEIAKSGNYMDCASLDTSEDKNRIEKCYSYVGRQQNDVDACRAASGNYQDNCLEEVAIDLKDETLCEEINSKYSKGDCYTGIAIKKKNPDLCAALETDQRNECYKEYALERNKPEICDEISSEQSIDTCYYDIAIDQGDSTYCSEIFDAEKQADCFTALDVAAETTGECKYDNECDAICTGDTKWEMGCNPRTNTCEKTIEVDCAAEYKDTYNGIDFPQTCSEGACVRNQAEIDAVKAGLEDLQDEVSDHVKDLIAYRQEITALKLKANHNCLDGLSDATNKFIIESSLKLGSVANSGVEYVAKGSSISSTAMTVEFTDDTIKAVSKPTMEFTKKFTQDAVGYFGDWTDKLVEKMYKLNQAPEDAKPPIEDYIAFWCDYNKYLGEMLDATAMQLDQQLAVAEAIEDEIKALP